MIIAAFIWDDGNSRHIARHYVTPDEVEEVFIDRFIILKTKNQRYLALGRSGEGRYLTIVFEKNTRKRAIRVITARDMDYKERAYYKRKVL